MAKNPETTPDRKDEDDRKLVAADEPFDDASFEDQVIAFWDKHQKTILVLVVAASVLALAFPIAAYVSELRREALQAEYSEARENGSLRAFAESHAKQPLGGMALLNLANDAYEAGDYSSAADDYAAARDAFGDHPARERALVGFAMATLKSGETTEARRLLEAIATDSTLLDTSRGEAAYALAILDWEAGDIEGVRARLNLIDGFEGSGFWKRRADLLRTSIPELDQIES